MNSELLALIPNELKNISGSVFYSGSDAFEGQKPLYILGLNPGGLQIDHGYQTLEYHTQKNLGIKNWSEYRDEVWRGNKQGTSGLQPRILHLLNKLNLNPSDIPASNVVFARTQNENKLRSNFNYYAELCWPFHEFVIKSQKIKNIICFGKTGGNFIKNKLNANVFVDEYIENNQRKWKTKIFTNNDGVNVVIVSHPSRADWTNPDSDPSNFIKKNLKIKSLLGLK